MRGYLRALLGTSASFLILAACGLDDSVIDAFPLSDDGGAPFDASLDASNDGSNDGSTDAASDATLTDASNDGSFVDAADAGPLTDAQADASDAEADAGFDGGDGGDGGDAGVDAGPCPTLTLCDSDASVCANGQICVPDIPAGWTLLGYDPHAVTSPAACGSSYAARSTIEITDGGSVTCACACNAGTAPSCTNAQVVLTTATGCTTTATTEPINASCTDLGASYTVSDAVLEAHLQADPTTCTAVLDAAVPSDVVGNARACDFNGGSGAFCASHATCVATNGATHKTCISKAYSGVTPPACGTSCPTGFQSSCYATAASDTDTRQCSSCTCGWSDPGCGSATITGSDTSGCGGGASHNVQIGADTCAPFTLSTVTALGVSGTSGAPTCDQTAPATASGSFVAAGESIVCCAN